jgi:DNA-binding IclR family transcriptional regulator
MSIQSVERAIAILNAIAERGGTMGLPELSEKLGLPKTTIHTLVKTLKTKGFVQQNPSTKKYGLGFALYELGAIQVAEQEIQRVASVAVEQLANDLDVECRLGIWHQQSIIITQTALPIHRRNRGHQIGPRIPAYCTALGKAILAFLPDEELTDYLEQVDLVAYTTETITDKVKLKEELARIRRQAYSVSKGELMPYRSAMGAPIIGQDERVEGAISISLEAQHTDHQKLEALAHHLLRATQEVSISLGRQPIRIMLKP